MSLAAELARLALSARTQGFAPEVRHHAVRALIDWTSATLAAVNRPEAAMLQAALEPATGPVQLLGGGQASPRDAALINGTLSHLVELDDIYSPALYHPGCPTVAAALAAAQAAGASGATLLDAIILGYEVGNRIGEALQPAHYRYWHTTGTIGCLGAAAAASVAFGLDEAAFTHALTTATSCTAGLQQAFRSDAMTKPLHAGRAAEAGVLAAQLARAGWTGEPAMLEGPAGLAAATAEGADLSGVSAAFGAPWTVTRMTHKAHACCGHTFAAIDGALALRAAVGDIAAVRAIRVETYATAVSVAGIAAPRTPFEAKFSIAFALASALADGRTRLDAFTPERVSDPRLQALAAKVELHAAERFDRAFPAMRGASVAITLADGRVLRRDQPDRGGSPGVPLSDREIDAKFCDLAGGALGADKAGALLVQLHGIGAAADCRLAL